MSKTPLEFNYSRCLNSSVIHGDLMCSLGSVPLTATSRFSLLTPLKAGGRRRKGLGQGTRSHGHTYHEGRRKLNGSSLGSASLL